MLTQWIMRLVGALSLVIAALPVRAGERKEFPLKYRLSTDIADEFGSEGQYLEPTTRRIALKEEPKYHCRQPLYATMRLGARKDPYTLVLDNSTSQRLGYDILYFDANRDGRMTSEEKLTGVPTNRGMRFGPIKLRIDCGQEKCPQWFLFRLLENEVQTASAAARNQLAEPAGRLEIQRHLVVMNAGYYQGQVTFGNQKRLLAVVDADGNGLYNDCMRVADREGDRLVIDLDGDGKLDGSYQSEEAQPMGRTIQVGGRYWHLDVAPDGSSVSVEPLNKALGTLFLAPGSVNLLLRGDEGVLRIQSDAGMTKLPAGKYRLLEYGYRLTDENGKPWRFLFQSQRGKGKTVSVLPGKTVNMPLGLGPPLVPKVSVARASDNQLTLSLEIRGAGDELLTNAQIGKNERPPAPKARISDSTGRELALLDFHYG